MATKGQLERLCVVLVGTRNPLNIGAAARAMSNFGVSELRLVNPYNPSFREARSAVGAAPLLKKALQFSTLAEAVRDCSLAVGTTAATNREPQQPLRSLDDGAKSIRRRLRSDRVALLFGSEKRESVRVGTESILAAAPEVIIDIHYGRALSPEQIERERAAWKTLPAVPAVRMGRVALLVGDEYVVPGPRLADAAEAIADLIHPGRRK